MNELLVSVCLSAFSVLLTAVVGYSVKRLQAREDEKQKVRELDSLRQTAVEKGMRAILRDRLLQSCEHFQGMGWADIRSTQNIQMMYTAYHDLGGNDIVTDVYEAFRNLPHYPNRSKEGQTACRQ